MNNFEKNVLKVVKEVAKEKDFNMELPARCYSFFYQPKRPVKAR